MSDLDRREADQAFRTMVLTAIEQLRSGIQKMEHTHDERFSGLHEKLDEVEKAILGDMGVAGFDERIREVERWMRESRIILLGDHGPLKEEGLVAYVRHLQSGEQAAIERRRQTLVFAATVLAGILGVLGTWGPKIIDRINNPPAIQVPHRNDRQPPRRRPRRPRPEPDFRIPTVPEHVPTTLEEAQ